MQLLKDKKFVRLVELIDILKTSEATIRRDLNELEADKKLIRVHGGAKLLLKNNFERDMIQKRKINLEEKKKIAKKASRFLKDNQRIYLDAGTTTTALIPYILEKNDIAVVTNGYSHIQDLIKNGVRVFLIGGEVKKKTQAIVGAVAVLSIKNFHFDVAFLGANSIDDEGCMTPDPEEAIVNIVFAERKKVKIITEEGELR